MSLEDKHMGPMKTALFRDEHHVRRLEVRPYERMIALCRGHKPKVIAADAIGHGMLVLSMAPIDEDAKPEFPAALVVVDAMNIKMFAGWEVEDTDQMLDYLIANGDRVLRSH